MKPNCLKCGCEDLDMGIDRSMRCPKCGYIEHTFGPWSDIPDIERLK